MNPRSAFGLILLVTLIVFFVVNTDPVSVSLIVTEQSISLALVIIISTLIGFVLGIIVPRIFRGSEEHYRIPQNEKHATEDNKTPEKSSV